MVRPARAASLASVAVALVLSLAACASDVVITQDGRDITFPSDGFRLVGDLRLPEGPGPHPAVVMVHGDGSQSRTGNGAYLPIMERFLDEGFAVFSWDKPGTGASTGSFGPGRTLTERAQILADAVEVLSGVETVDPERIGVWGLSQAGYVMPLALERTNAIAFMISVSGPGEDGTQQMGYLIGQQMRCAGHAEEEAVRADDSFVQYASATTYEQYREAMEYIVRFPVAARYGGSEVLEPDQWRAWPPDSDAFVDPTEILYTTTIPVLAIFGERDTNIDPVQGAAAYRTALSAAGNEDFRVETIAGVGHVMTVASTGCIGEPAGAYAAEYLDLMAEWLASL